MQMLSIYFTVKFLRDGEHHQQQKHTHKYILLLSFLLDILGSGQQLTLTQRDSDHGVGGFTQDCRDERMTQYEDRRMSFSQSVQERRDGCTQRER